MGLGQLLKAHDQLKRSGKNDILDVLTDPQAGAMASRGGCYHDLLSNLQCFRYRFELNKELMTRPQTKELPEVFVGSTHRSSFESFDIWSADLCWVHFSEHHSHKIHLA